MPNNMENQYLTYLKKWLNELEINNMSQNTICAYKADVEFYLSYCHDHNLDLNDLEITDIREFVIYCTERKQLSTVSVKRYLTAIRGFMQWLKRNNHITVDASQDVKIKRLPRSLPNIISEEEMSQLLDQPDPPLEFDKWLWKRDKAMFEVLYSSGLRVSELINLSIHDINLGSKLVRVIAGKGNKDRVVPLGSKACHALEVWLQFRLQNKPEDDALFITHLGNRISVKQVRKRINQQANRAGLEQHLYPHLFRHCFATHLLAASNNIRAVQEMLGHSNISSTEIYTHLDFNNLAQSYDAAHPRANKKGNTND